MIKISFWLEKHHNLWSKILYNSPHIWSLFNSFVKTPRVPQPFIHPRLYHHLHSISLTSLKLSSKIIQLIIFSYSIKQAWDGSHVKLWGTKNSIECRCNNLLFMYALVHWGTSHFKYMSISHELSLLTLLIPHERLQK